MRRIGEGERLFTIFDCRRVGGGGRGGCGIISLLLPMGHIAGFFG